MTKRASFWNRHVTYGQVAVFGVTWAVLSTVRDVLGAGPAAVVALIGFVGVTLLEMLPAGRLSDKDAANMGGE